MLTRGTEACVAVTEQFSACHLSTPLCFIKAHKEEQRTNVSPRRSDLEFVVKTAPTQSHLQNLVCSNKSKLPFDWVTRLCYSWLWRVHYTCLSLSSEQQKPLLRVKTSVTPGSLTAQCWASVLAGCGWDIQGEGLCFGSSCSPFVLDLVRSMALQWSELQSDLRVLSSLISVPLGSSTPSVCPNRWPNSRILGFWAEMSKS